ncbi:MAG: oxygen-dependent tRNA uridine(34) hydroxylase TrhO [Gulosibacter sp.]|uniref:oxygen-dependent tRNA uridine(34) hydroxylase TrhO n=1 Tax=Gulosibacter sp. TaxID=2817531 RepID=UPI003F919D2B
MAVPKILLYYVFTPLSDPEAIRLWQRDLCERLGLRGRIIVSPHGINGTVGGDIDACKQYVRRLREYPAFHNVDMKWSDGTGLDEDGFSLDFPKLSVKARDEIVSFGAPEQLQVDEHGVVGGGQHLAPDELHTLLEEKPDAVFFDGRNAIEAEVGRFRDAIVPKTDTTHDFISEIESGKYDDLKDKPVVTYCTGGVRCEVLSALMIERGFQEVYQLDGGIVRYGERFGNDGLWEGSLTVFDAREHIDFAPNPKVLGQCHRCANPTPRLQNCGDPSCRERLVTCESCSGSHIRCTTHAATEAQG